MESALRGTQRSTPYWSLLVLLKVLLVSPHICSQIHILFSFYANIVYWVFSAVSSVDDCLKTLLSTRMLLIAECFSRYFCSLSHSQPQSNPVSPRGSGWPTEEKTWHSESQDDAWMGARGMCDTKEAPYCLAHELWAFCGCWVWTQTSFVRFTEVFSGHDNKIVFPFHFAF